MPFVDIHSSDDYVAIHYVTNTNFSNVSGLNPDKPTLVILHPAFLDSSWIDLQMNDENLGVHYNIVAFDMRSSGRSSSRPSGRHDTWVDAADLALCFQKLHLPPCHILANGGTSIYCATRFALLFPEMCLSLALVNVPAPVELKWIYKNMDELIHAACFADDVDSFEQAAYEFLEFLFGPRTDRDLMDELVTWWGIAHPPRDRARTAEMTSVYINRTPLSPELYAQITQPVLIVQGEKNELCPAKYAEKLASQLTGVKGGVSYYTVKGYSTMISIIPDAVYTVNATVATFLARLPRARSDLLPPQTPVKERMEMALQKLSEIIGDPDMESLDSMSSLSFACLSPEISKAQTDLLKRYGRDAETALDLTDVESWSRRLYSERRMQEEASGKAFNGARSDPERPAKSSTRSVESGDSPLFKNTFTSTTSLEKVPAKPQGNVITNPLQRLRA
ncbi:alpha/beta-hydrolase [Crepidotus variabilis]|uniref:Alpha/beta-hydrolase n=1 Tax=Crepidotus variabilis TaxID=179855 RepID=A0A9P6ERZ7_9AGAR|nr:alpha/beta-hydrolase [Crepidotus variabilis]